MFPRRCPADCSAATEGAPSGRHRRSASAHSDPPELVSIQLQPPPDRVLPPAHQEPSQSQDRPLPPGQHRSAEPADWARLFPQWFPPPAYFRRPCPPNGLPVSPRPLPSPAPDRPALALPHAPPSRRRDASRSSPTCSPPCPPAAGSPLPFCS